MDELTEQGLARLSHSGWRVELPAGAGSTILVPGIRSRRRVSGGGGLGGCPVLFVGGRNERSQAAAARGRSQAAAKMSWDGHAEAKANLTPRTLTVTCAPIFNSFRRIVPHVADASCVPASAMRRRAHIRTYASD